jgi:hypothetical protein
MQARTIPGISASVVGIQDHEGVLDPPVGGIGDMRHPAHAVKGDVVAPGQASQTGEDRLAQLPGFLEMGRETIHCAIRQAEQTTDPGVALAALLDLVETMPQGVDQQVAAFPVIKQIVEQIGIAADHPDIAQHLEQHARRTAGLALAAQFLDQGPTLAAEQAQDDLPVGKRGVVVGDFSQANAGGGECGHRNHQGRRDRKTGPEILPQRSIGDTRYTSIATAT